MANTYQTPKNFDLKNTETTYGTLTERKYPSKTTNSMRKCWVYTPPDFKNEHTYPILYLLHGIGGTHNEWLAGNPNEVISNLIHEKMAKPMIVVIPNVRARVNDAVPEEIFNQEHFLAFDNFINDLRDELMPFIEKNYQVATTRENCAIAGLSMGGREALYIGFKMPETFGYIGAFSPAPGLLPMQHLQERHHPGQLAASEMTFPNAYKANTFILMCSGYEEEMFNDVVEAYKDAMDSNGIKYDYFVTAGGHDFRVWKVGLYHFIKKLFVR
jgi:enterochelin esterase-like enzyme